MGLYHDPRWSEILDIQIIPRTPVRPITAPRTQGFKNYTEMDRKWGEAIDAHNWVVPHRKAKELVNEYFEDCRKLRVAIDHKHVKADSTQDHAVTVTFGGLSALKPKIEAATSLAELNEERESYLKSNAVLVEHIYDPLLAEYHGWLDELKKQDQLASALNTLTGIKQKAAAELRTLALKTTTMYNALHKPICHMVCVAVDLSDGSLESGRAGHGWSAKQLEAAIGFKLPELAASAFSTENPYNCAELDALYNLKTKHQGVEMKNVYFASMMPGGSPIIPPCTNCQRWIVQTGAKAAKFND